MLTHSHARLVEWGDCDPAGIVFHPRYIAYFDHCTSLLFAMAGFDSQDLPARFNVIGFPVVDLRAKFLAPCRFGEEVLIDTSVASFRNSSFDVKHTLYCAGRLAVEAVVTRVWAGHHVDDPLRLKSKTIPEEVKSALSEPLNNSSLSS